MWDLLMRWNTKTNQAHIDYVKDMGLTAIRFEGTIGNEELYDMADKAGILLMPGFVCCSRWQSDNAWSAEETNVAYASLDSQMRNLRAHASPFVFAFGSDAPPLAAHLTQYQAIATNLHWQNPTLENVASYSNANAGSRWMARMCGSRQSFGGTPASLAALLVPLLRKVSRRRLHWKAS